MSELSKTLEVKIQQNTFQISFPTIGQEIDIENKKLSLAGGMFSEMMVSNPRLAMTIEAIATFTTLIPNLKKHFNGFDSLFELDRNQIQTLMDAYTKSYSPWYREWEESFKKVAVDEDSQKD